MGHLTRQIKCLTLFSTHYHMLLDEFKEHPGVQSYHMAFRENEDQILFLYKFVKGECPSSFGLNVARLAGLPESVLARAKDRSMVF